MPELKPCPFCGKKDKRLIIGENFLGEYRVEHFCTFTILGRKFYRSEENAIDEWNRRTNRDQ